MGCSYACPDLFASLQGIEACAPDQFISPIAFPGWLLWLALHTMPALPQQTDAAQTTSLNCKRAPAKVLQSCLFKRVPSPYRQCSMLTRRSWRATQQRGTSLTSWCSPTTAQRAACASSTAPSTTVRETHPWQCLIPLGGCRADQAPSASSVTNRETGDMRGRGSLGAQLPPAISFTPGSLAAFCTSRACSGRY